MNPRIHQFLDLSKIGKGIFLALLFLFIFGIFSGEIRDPDTAAVVMEAGLVGHLVFSTVHAGSVASVIIRLLDMGVTPGTLIASLTAVISQRLVRRLCPKCREKSSVWPAEMEKIEQPGDIDSFFAGKGCDACEFTGYQGRQGIFELVVLDDAIRGAILAGSGIGEMKRVIRESATSTLWEHGWQLVAEGITDPRELLRVIGE